MPFTGFLLNAILIFGLFGLPAMGVKGAAIATVISRFVELLILVFKTHFNTEKYPFIVKAYASFKVPKTLLKQIIIKGLPLMLNEFLWALAMILRNQCYSTRGLDVVAAQNISATLFNVFNVIYMALGNAAAIIIGAELGAGEIEKAKTDADKLMAFSVIITIGIAVLYAETSLFFPYVYNTSEEVRVLARNMMLLSSINMPFVAYANSVYFTMRSGGKVAITFIFDSGFMWVIVMPLCFILSYLTSLPIIPLYIICQATESIKAFFGASLYRKKTWAKSLVNNELQ
jgi:Na+-driven multidrug efflux pump